MNKIVCFRANMLGNMLFFFKFPELLIHVWLPHTSDVILNSLKRLTIHKAS
jgi:hypothetical protein